MDACGTEDILLRVLPDKLYAESISRSEECFDRFYVHIIIKNLKPETVAAERVEMTFKNTDLGSTLNHIFEGKLLHHLFQQSQKFIDKSETATLEIPTLKSRGIVDYRFETKGFLRFNEVECAFWGRTSAGEIVCGVSRNDICREKPKTILTLPLQGKWWVAGGHSSFEPHSTSFLPAITYAYDFIQIGEGTKSYRGEGLTNADYYAYGQSVLAAADGVIVAVTDGIEENLPSKTPSDAPALYKDAQSIPMPGNHVVIKHEDDEYTFYAHLQPGICVRMGQKVRRREIIGKVGNSGESTEPHLHFHFADGISLKRANAIPISFACWFEDAYGISPVMVEEGVVLSREIIESAKENRDSASLA